MKRGCLLGLVLVFSLVVFTDSAYAKDRIVICGTGDSQSILREMAVLFERHHPDIDVDVPDSIGSSGGIRMTARGRCDLGRVARKLKRKEQKYHLKYLPFAYSPVVFAANLGGMKTLSLSTEEILDIFAGKIKTWMPYIGQDRPIYVANREPGDSSRRVLEKTFPGWRNIKHFAGKTVFSTPELVSVLTNNRYTIGYGPLSMLQDRGLTIISIDGFAPDIKNVQDGRYRYLTPFGIVWKGRLEGPSRSFVDFLFSKEARALLLKRGLIPSKR